MSVQDSRLTVIRGFFSSRLKASSVQGSRLKTQDFLQFCSRLSQGLVSSRFEAQPRFKVIQGLFQCRAAGCSAVHAYLIV